MRTPTLIAAAAVAAPTPALETAHAAAGPVIGPLPACWWATPTVTRVNVRSAPNASARIVTTLRRDQGVTATVIGPTRPGWRRVKTRSQISYVAASSTRTYWTKPVVTPDGHVVCR